MPDTWITDLLMDVDLHRNVLILQLSGAHLRIDEWSARSAIKVTKPPVKPGAFYTEHYSKALFDLDKSVRLPGLVIESGTCAIESHRDHLCPAGN